MLSPLNWHTSLKIENILIETVVPNHFITPIKTPKRKGEFPLANLSSTIWITQQLSVFVIQKSLLQPIKGYCITLE